MKDSNRLFKELDGVWSPIWASAVCEGSVWSPSAMLLELWALHSKGLWIEAFVEALIDQVGIRSGLNLIEVPPHFVNLEFWEVQERLAKFRGGLAWGVWRNYDLSPVVDSVKSDGLAKFRGVLLAPWRGLRVKMDDRLIVLNSE